MGTRLCPPARTFESFLLFSREIASEMVEGECNSKGRGIIPKLHGVEK
jgi:hypothetical protein